MLSFSRTQTHATTQINTLSLPFPSPLSLPHTQVHSALEEGALSAYGMGGLRSVGACVR